MTNILEKQYCIIHCRVSSPKQAKEGESLIVQMGICQKIAEQNNWQVEHSPWLESLSGRKKKRPVFEDILSYLDENPGKIKKYVFRSIDRFTRGGTYAYDSMKQELSKRGVDMVDSYGVIQPSKNTLEGLGQSYVWSKYYPSEITEAVLATTAKQEVTNILTRMIGQSIRNTQQGYRTRRAADGYINQKVFVDGKKKVIQVPDPNRSKYYRAMFDLRTQSLTDPEIVNLINSMGFRSQIQDRYDKEHTKIIGKIGGNPLTVKQFQRIISNPIYAGIMCEKWTSYEPVRAQYDGIVSIEQYNRANRGSVSIQTDPDGLLKMVHGKLKTGKYRDKNNPLFPYKFVLCSVCHKPYLGSSPRSKSGKKHAIYHCARGHKYQGFKKADFDKTVEACIKSLKFNQDILQGLELTFYAKYRQREKEIVSASSDIHQNIADLEAEQALKLEAFTSTKSVIIRDKLEKEIESLEMQINSSQTERGKIQITRDDIKGFIAEAKEIMEHPAKILLNQSNSRAQAMLFELIFEEIPTYTQILNGTPKLSWIFKLSSEFAPSKSQLVSLLGIEPIDSLPCNVICNDLILPQ